MSDSSPYLGGIYLGAFYPAGSVNTAGVIIEAPETESNKIYSDIKKDNNIIDIE